MDTTGTKDRRLKLIEDVPEEQLFRTAKVAELLACSRSHVLALINEGRIGYVDLTEKGTKRRDLRIPVSALREYIESRAIPARRSA